MREFFRRLLGRTPDPRRTIRHFDHGRERVHVLAAPAPVLARRMVFDERMPPEAIAKQAANLRGDLARFYFLNSAAEAAWSDWSEGARHDTRVFCTHVGADAALRRSAQAVEIGMSHDWPEWATSLVMADGVVIDVRGEKGLFGLACDPMDAAALLSGFPRMVDEHDE